MANKTINELSPLTPSSTSQFAIYQNGSTGKVNMSQILGNTLYADDQEEPTGEVEFTSSDELNPSSSTSVDLLTGNDSWGQRFAKISQMFKNVRYLLGKLGTTDISTIGNGTVTGAISNMNTNMNAISTATGTITNGTGTISLAKNGKVVSIYINQVNTSASALTTFATIPEGFRPKLGTYCTVSFPADGTAVNISPTGNLQLNYATTNNIYGSATYVIP